MGLRYALFAALAAVARAADGDAESCPTNLKASACYSGVTASAAGPIMFCSEPGYLIEKIVGSVYISPKSNATSCKSEFSADYTCTSDCCVNKIKAIEDLCVDKEFCTITDDEVQGALKSVDRTASACGNNSALLDVHVKCKEPSLDLGPIFAICLVFVISMALGTTIEIDHFKEIIADKKKACAIGFASQFGFMPLMSWGMCQVFGFDARVATGLIITGCAPGGTTSNLLTYYAKGNVALSFAMSSASTLAALFMVPLLYFLYVKQTYEGDGVEMPVSTIFVFLVGTLIVPCGIGILIRLKGSETPFGCGNNKKKLHVWVEKIGAVIGLIFLALAMVSGISENPQLITGVALYWREWICALIFQPLGSIFGYTLAKLGGLDGPDSRAVCIETGVQNYTMVIGLLAVGTVGCERAMTLRCVYLCTICYVANSAWITCVLSKLAGDEPKEDTENAQELSSP